jgi:hypothetical protein
MASREQVDSPPLEPIGWFIARIVAVPLALVASHDAFFASLFRLEGSFELRMIERVDLEIGAMFAFAMLLFFAPNCRWNPKAWLLAIIGAAVIWTCVSGWLISSHRWQYRVRSTPSPRATYHIGQPEPAVDGGRDLACLEARFSRCGPRC